MFGTGLWCCFSLMLDHGPYCLWSYCRWMVQGSGGKYRQLGLVTYDDLVYREVSNVISSTGIFGTGMVQK